MTQFTLELDELEQRPIVHMGGTPSLDAMLDTGAVFPIWVADELLLQKLVAIMTKKCVPFGGFGGTTTGNLYTLPYFRVGELIFPEFPLVAAPHKLPCQMLLSATVFSKLIYEIDDKHHRLNVTVPDDETAIRKLSVKDENGRLYILCEN